MPRRPPALPSSHCFLQFLDRPFWKQPTGRASPFAPQGTAKRVRRAVAAAGPDVDDDDDEGAGRGGSGAAGRAGDDEDL